MFRGPITVLGLVKGDMGMARCKSAYTIRYVICKLNDFRDATCPAAVAGFPIEDRENLILMERSLPGRERVSELVGGSEDCGWRQQSQQQVLGCRYTS